MLELAMVKRTWQFYLHAIIWPGFWVFIHLTWHYFNFLIWRRFLLGPWLKTYLNHVLTHYVQATLNNNCFSTVQKPFRLLVVENTGWSVLCYWCFFGSLIYRGITLWNIYSELWTCNVKPILSGEAEEWCLARGSFECILWVRLRMNWPSG